MIPEEYLEIVDVNGEVVGSAPRSKVHGDPSLVHRVVHVLVLNKGGEILLQKRSENKDVAPGRWDTSVGGHVGIGEDLITSSMREMYEELGVTGDDPEYLYSYMHSNAYETELVTTFRYVYDGEFYFNREEIDEIRFWSFDEIRKSAGRTILSDNFEHEFSKYIDYLGSAL
jgi:isopentenyldiphosphate isomerase